MTTAFNALNYSHVSFVCLGDWLIKSMACTRASASATTFLWENTVLLYTFVRAFCKFAKLATLTDADKLIPVLSS